MRSLLINNVYEYEKWLQKGKQFIITSKKDGFNHINLKKDIRRKNFNRMLGLTILKDLKN